jgi:hypothetical protein
LVGKRWETGAFLRYSATKLRFSYIPCQKKKWYFLGGGGKKFFNFVALCVKVNVGVIYRRYKMRYKNLFLSRCVYE